MIVLTREMKDLYQWSKRKSEEIRGKNIHNDSRHGRRIILFLLYLYKVLISRGKKRNFIYSIFKDF